MIRFIISYFHNHQARKRLGKIVKRNRESFECEQYRRRRAAALKGIGKPSGGERRTEEGRTTYAKA